MRKLLIAFGVILFLLIAAIFIIPSLVPESVYKDKIQETVSNRLGREVVIDGKVKLSVFPTVKASAASVRIDNPDGFTDETFASMDDLRASVKLLPLLSKQVEIKEFTLVNPVINLEKTKDGQVNWAFGGNQAAPVTKPETSSEGFKRDGRFADLEMALGNFSLENGTVNYADNVKGSTQSLANVNVTLEMPGLDQKVAAKGDLVLNGEPINIDVSLNTPRAFLNGEDAPFNANIKSDLISMTSDGSFTPSQNITIDTKLDASIPSTSALAKLINYKSPFLPMAEKASIKGQISYDGNAVSATGTEISALSDLMDLQFKGDFNAGTATSAAGDLSLDISSVSGLANALEINLPQVSLVETMTLKAALSTDGKVTTGKNVSFQGKGTNVNVNYSGGVVFDQLLSLDGAIDVTGNSVPGLMTQLGMQDMPGVNALGNFDVKGKLSGPITELKLAELNAATKGETLDASYTGALSLGPVPALDGGFKLNIPSVPTLTSKLNMPQIPATANILGNLDVNGKVSGKLGDLAIKGMHAETKSADLSAKYDGDITLKDTVSLNGVFDASSPSIKALAGKTGVALPYADALGALRAKGRVSGSTNALSITAIDTALSDGLLNVDFKGDIKTGETVSFNGDISTDIPSIRKLAAVSGAALPPSTEAGAVYESFSLSGKASGNSDAVKVSNANIKFDNLAGTGEVTTDLTKSKPYVNGTLAMNGLDIRPYMAAMAAQKPEGIQPWSENKLNLTALNLFDGDFNLTTPNVITTSVEMGPSKIDAKINNGVLTAKMPNVTLYGGQGNLDMSLNASRQTPTFALNFDLNSLNAKSFLGAAANFTKLTGNTGTSMKINGSGNSMAEMMRSLSGGGNFEVAEGIITGIDIAQFVGGLDTALQTRALPAGVGGQYTTAFSKLDGLFSMDNGVARVGKFSLNGKNVLAEGQGSLDIGNQKLDFSLRPRLTNKGGLAGLGIPIKLSGGFGNIKAGLDTDLLSQIVAEQAKARAQQEITNRLGGALGLGNITGSSPTDSGNASTTSPEQAIGGILGGILGGQQQPSNQPAQPAQGTGSEQEKPAEKKPVDPLENVLGGLFGGGKEKDQ